MHINETQKQMGLWAEIWGKPDMCWGSVSRMASDKQYEGRILFSLTCRDTIMPFIIISSTSSKHQMPRYSATSTVSGQLPSASWDICIHSLTWITLFSLHLFEMTRQLPSSALCLSGFDGWLTRVQISLLLQDLTLFLTPVMFFGLNSLVLFVCETLWISLVCHFHHK